MDPPAATDALEVAAPPQRRRRGARLVEYILHFTICLTFLSLLKLEPIARNSVQDSNSMIDLPSQPLHATIKEKTETTVTAQTETRHTAESSSSDAPRQQTSEENNTIRRHTTKIVAISDITFAPIALEWHRRLIKLGYPPHQPVVVAADDATISYLQNANISSVEPMLHPKSEDWPVADPKMKGQVRRRTIFATRWIYVLHQLRNEYSILLTDADNIFVRYLDTIELEHSGYDVIHAYCHNFPIRFLSMGFVVCGGMMWLKGNENRGVDGPAVKYVLSILEQCGWNRGNNSSATLGDSNHDDSVFLSRIHPFPLKAPAARCDDQQVINSKFFSNTLNYTWTVRPSTGFWKQEAYGTALLTGHKFKIWDVETAYRGPVDGSNEDGISNGKKCPTVGRSWVSMPENTVEYQGVSFEEERTLRLKQWYQFCVKNETKNVS